MIDETGWRVGCMKRCIVLILVILLLLPNTSKAASSDAVSILLLGTDDIGEQPVDSNEEISRSDAIFVITLQPKTRAIKLLSIERDYLVDLPNDLGKNKLGVSSFFGGPQMTLDAVNQLLQLDLPRYMHIDIKNLIKVIDIMGGVDVEIHEDEVEAVNTFINAIMTYTDLKNVVAGINHLGGPEAWAFLGVRDNDIQTVESNSVRNDRQRRVMTAFLDIFYKMDLAKAINLANEIIPLIRTNLTMNDLLSLIKSVISCDFAKISYMRTPIGEYKMQRINMHMVVVVSNMQQEIENVHKFLFD